MFRFRTLLLRKKKLGAIIFKIFHQHAGFISKIMTSGDGKAKRPNIWFNSATALIKPYLKYFKSYINESCMHTVARRSSFTIYNFLAVLFSMYRHLPQLFLHEFQCDSNKIAQICTSLKRESILLSQSGNFK